MSKFHFARVVRVIFAFAIISAAFTATSFAQTAASGSTAQPGAGPTTRASEKADLKNPEAHGYRPVANESTYPNDVQKAEKATYGSGATGGTGARHTTTPASPNN